MLANDTGLKNRSEGIRIIEDLQNRGREILSRNRDGLDRIAQALIERETLDRQQLDQLLKRAA